MDTFTDMLIADNPLINFNISQFFSELNVFSDVDFSDLYGWLPGDISAVCALLINFCIIMFVIGIIKWVIAL